MIRTFSAAPEHIDELGHVNNAVWVQWIQDIATVVEGAESPALAQFFARCSFGDDPFQSVPMRARP